MAKPQKKEDQKKAKSKSIDKKKKYSQETLKKALDEIKKGRSKKSISKTFGIPRSTLIFHIQNPDKKDRPGPPTVLSSAEEEELVQWIKVNSRKGFPKRKEDIIASVGEFIQKSKRQTSFKDGLPGEKWYQLFLKRHPDIVSRTPEAVTAASSCVSESDIRHWFKGVEDYLKSQSFDSILNDPSRILNGDETNFLLCPKSGKVLSSKGAKNVYEIDQGQAKSSLTVMFTFKADGEQTPPMIIYPNKRLPKDITAGVPDNWGIGLSENGWMKTELFIEYIQNVLYPHLIKTKTQFPVILFVDGHKTHATLGVSELCTELQIILIALYPNATRILQPADVAAFKPLKNAWRKSVLEWRRSHPTEALTKVDFAPILKNAIEKSLHPETLRNGFKASGLYPWQPDNIDFSKCLGGNQTKTHQEKNENLNKEITMDRKCFVNIIKEHQSRTNDKKTLKENILKSVFNYFQVSFDFNLQSSSSTLKSDNTVVDIQLEITDSNEQNLIFQKVNSPHKTNDQDTGTRPNSATLFSTLITDSHQKMDDQISSPNNIDRLLPDHLDISNLPVILVPDICSSPDVESQGPSFLEIAATVEIHDEPAEVNLEKTIPARSAETEVLSTTVQKTINSSNLDEIEVFPENVSEFDLKESEYLYFTPPKQRKTSVDTNLTEAIRKSMKKIQLNDVLVVAKTPLRKGVKKTEKTSFVLTCEERQKIEKEKAKIKTQKEEEAKKRKEERTKKIAVQNEIKNLKKQTKKANTFAKKAPHTNTKNKDLNTNIKKETKKVQARRISSQNVPVTVHEKVNTDKTTIKSCSNAIEEKNIDKNKENRSASLKKNTNDGEAFVNETCETVERVKQQLNFDDLSVQNRFKNINGKPIRDKDIEKILCEKDSQ